MFVCVDFVSSIYLGKLYCVSQECLLTGVPDFTFDPCNFAWFKSEDALLDSCSKIKKTINPCILIGVDHEIVNLFLEREE